MYKYKAMSQYKLDRFVKLTFMPYMYEMLQYIIVIQ